MKTPVLESTFNKFIDLKACDFVKKTPAPASFCETVKNTFFYKNTSGGCFWKGSMKGLA